MTRYGAVRLSPGGASSPDSVAFLQAIDATWVTVLSYIPFFTPMIMFGRLALGAASWWEGLLSVGMLLVFTVLLTWLSSRVYRAGVLLYGRKPTTAQIFKLMWAKNR